MCGVSFVRGARAAFDGTTLFQQHLNCRGRCGCATLYSKLLEIAHTVVLATKWQCFCLFATHYHELTRLEALHPNVIVNSHASASVVDNQLILLHKIVAGPATHSLGLHVARLADLPDSIIEKWQCFCLFATHYHELTRLEALHPNVIVNSHASASVVDNQLILLHKIVAGPATHSLGLHVARLADLPDSIIEYAEAKQAELETNLFEAETAVKSQETAEGQKIILDFLKKCKQIQESTADDDVMMKEIEALKQDVLKQNNQIGARVPVILARLLIEVLSGRRRNFQLI
ncbi:mutS domain V domain-containing protein [Phthorimaea operculella]|nr:mutS domain V domain-containing protein [Phthorimaea operculella]